MISFAGAADGDDEGDAVAVLLGDDSGVEVGLDEGVEETAEDGLVSTWLGLGVVLLLSDDVHAAPTRAMADRKPMAAERPVISQREV